MLIFVIVEKEKHLYAVKEYLQKTWKGKLFDLPSDKL